MQGTQITVQAINKTQKETKTFQCQKYTELLAHLQGDFEDHKVIIKTPRIKDQTCFLKQAQKKNYKLKVDYYLDSPKKCQKQEQSSITFTDKILIYIFLMFRNIKEINSSKDLSKHFHTDKYLQIINEINKYLDIWNKEGIISPFQSHFNELIASTLIKVNISQLLHFFQYSEETITKLLEQKLRFFEEDNDSLKAVWKTQITNLNNQIEQCSVLQYCLPLYNDFDISYRILLNHFDISKKFRDQKKSVFYNKDPKYLFIKANRNIPNIKKNINDEFEVRQHQRKYLIKDSTRKKSIRPYDGKKHQNYFPQFLDLHKNFSPQLYRKYNDGKYKLEAALYVSSENTKIQTIMRFQDQQWIRFSNNSYNRLDSYEQFRSNQRIPLLSLYRVIERYDKGLRDQYYSLCMHLLPLIPSFQNYLQQQGQTFRKKFQENQKFVAYYFINCNPDPPSYPLEFQDFGLVLNQLITILRKHNAFYQDTLKIIQNGRQYLSKYGITSCPHKLIPIANDLNQIEGQNLQQFLLIYTNIGQKTTDEPIITVPTILHIFDTAQIQKSEVDGCEEKVDGFNQLIQRFSKVKEQEQEIQKTRDYVLYGGIFHKGQFFHDPIQCQQNHDCMGQLVTIVNSNSQSEQTQWKKYQIGQETIKIQNYQFIEYIEHQNNIKEKSMVLLYRNVPQI